MQQIGQIYNKNARNLFQVLGYREIRIDRSGSASICRYRARFKKNLEMLQRDISMFTKSLNSLKSSRQIGGHVTKMEQ